MQQEQGVFLEAVSVVRGAPRRPPAGSSQAKKGHLLHTLMSQRGSPTFGFRPLSFREQRHQKALSERGNLLQMGGREDHAHHREKAPHWYAHYKLNFVLSDQFLKGFLPLFLLLGVGGGWDNKKYYQDKVHLESPHLHLNLHLHLHTHRAHVFCVAGARLNASPPEEKKNQNDQRETRSSDLSAQKHRKQGSETVPVGFFSNQNIICLSCFQSTLLFLKKKINNNNIYFLRLWK